MSLSQRHRVTAVLGPTNTGKTYLAIERMLGHASGMIGFPLRLLARENYERVLRAKGAAQVALITGEEKILPPNARYFLCTVESMPVDRPVDFLAVDEIQLAADPERGHVFTDRLLHARGREETMFLGADTIRPLLARLVPEAAVIGRPRFSTLSYSGAKKLTRLPARSAVVAFSAAEVYALAELIRRQRGGTAVVLGALSPRTRNAQVAMFESGEVDYLVATDAIGMGLNLDLDHVAFARLSKFDGRAARRLSAAEVAQIAGRAGRHMSDGTFGTTAGIEGMDEELVEAVEEHKFPALTTLYWRSGKLDFRSVRALMHSLDAPPPAPELVRVRPPEDQEALLALGRDPEIEQLADNRETVRLLWEVCQVPDFRKTLSDQHTRLLGQIFRHLIHNDRRLPADWVAGQIARIDRIDGDIDALIARIAHVRTWTFVSHRADWLDDAAHWQGLTRKLEDRLSDALHERLTHRFVDRRTAVLLRRLQTGEELLAAVRGGGEVLVEGEHVGRLDGFRFRLDASIGKEDARAVLTATRRALKGEMPQRMSQLENDNDGAFRLDGEGLLYWREAAVARLAAGDSALRPQVSPLDSEFLDGPQRERLRRRLAAWLQRHLRNRLAPLFALEEAELKGAARGLAFQLAESLGTLPRHRVAPQLAALTKNERRALSALKVKLGAQSLYLPGLLKPATVALRALLWAVHRGLPVPAFAKPGAATLSGEPPFDEAFCLALGYRRLADRQSHIALRADLLERLSYALHKRAAAGPFALDEELARLAHCKGPALEAVLRALGYRPQRRDDTVTWRLQGGRRRKESAEENAKAPDATQARKGPPPDRKAPRRPRIDPDSPFAVLGELMAGGQG